MKKCLLILGMSFAVATGALAQTIVFEDDFEGYEVGTNLADEGYILWEGGATVQLEGETSNKIGLLSPSAQNYYFRREFTLEEGKSYTFELSTKSPDAKNHRVVARLGDRNVQGELINSTSWTNTILDFTIGAGETNVILWVYSFPQSVIHIDNYKLIDKDGTTHVSELKKSPVQMYPNPVRGLLNINHNARILSLKVSDITGKLIETKKNINRETYILDLTSYQKGVYFVAIQDDKGTRIAQKIFVQ